MQYGNNHKPWSITLLTTIALLTTNPKRWADAEYRPG